MNLKIKYLKFLQIPVISGFIAVGVTSCMGTQAVANRELDGIYSTPSDRIINQNDEYQIINDPVVRLGGRYFSEDMQAPQSFEQEIYQNNTIARIENPSKNDYVQWGEYQGTQMDYGYASYPYGLNSRYYSGYYSPYRLSLSFGFGFGYPIFSDFYNPYFMDYHGYYSFNRFYSPYYFGYSRPYYGYGYPYAGYYGYTYGSHYYGYSPTFVKPVHITRGKGMTSNVNDVRRDVRNEGFSSNQRIIRRGNDVGIVNSNNRKSSDDTNLRKRSIREVQASSSQRRQTYDSNSIRNQRNQDRVIYRRSRSDNYSNSSDFSTSRSSNWSNSSSQNRNTSTSNSTPRSGTGSRIRR